MDDARDARFIQAASRVLVAELLTRKLEIRLDPKEGVLPKIHSQPEPVPNSAAPAVRLPDVNAPFFFTKVDPSLKLCALEMQGAGSRNTTNSVAHLLHSCHGPPPCTEKTLPSSRLDTSLPPSHVARGPRLSSRPIHVMLHKQALQESSVDFLTPLCHQTLPKLQKLSSVCPVKTSLWRFSMPWRLASTPSMIVPSSHLNACASSVSFTSSQPSHVAAGSRLSSRPIHVMLHKEALQESCVDFLTTLCHQTLPKLQKLSSVCPVKTSLWRFSMPWRLASNAEHDRSIFAPKCLREQRLFHFQALSCCGRVTALKSAYTCDVGQRERSKVAESFSVIYTGADITLAVVIQP